MIAGFTGTQRGVSQERLDSLAARLNDDGVLELHHGDCVGADQQAHAIARSYNIRVILHPPDRWEKRAFCDHASETRRVKPYLARNREIVEECDILYAMPDGPERLRSGTWSTIRYAQKIGRPVVIL